MVGDPDQHRVGGEDRRKLEQMVLREQEQMLKSKSHKELAGGRSMKEKSDRFIERVSRKIKVLACQKEQLEKEACTFTPALVAPTGQKRTTEEFLAD